MSTDFRALCAELANDLQVARAAVSDWADYASDYFKQKHDLQGELDRIQCQVDRARAALAAPLEGEVGELISVIESCAGFTDESTPVGEVWAKIVALLEQLSAAAPAVAPVPVSERLPGEEDCDAEGRCWIFSKVESEWRLIDAGNPGVPHLKYCFSHWLPAQAIPLPAPQGGEVEA